jgi:quinoprotein glucose dehydrogenase
MRLLTSLILGLCVTSTYADWPTYGNDAGSSKYAPLTQINAANVSKLEVAWEWSSPDNPIAAKDRALTPGGFKSTPLMINGVLYTSTSLGHVAAIDAKTGESIWIFDTQTYADGRPTNLGFNHRGVAYWSDGDDARILMPTNNAYLWALDAKTGKPVESFGNSGRADLTLGLGRAVDRKQYSAISAPIVVKDILVVGSSILDGPRTLEMPPGHVRGFDIKTGEQKWIFHTIPQGSEFGADTWQGDAWKYSGNSNVWSGMSADLDLGYVYLPTGTPTNDWYGGHRLGDNLFAESLICVDAATGKRIWHFQMIHHGLWDYDLPAAPTLMDIVVDGKPIKAVAQVSKQAFLYVFDRVTGEPVWPIEERPVPPSNIPGEVASPTQPFPTKPAAFDHQGLGQHNLVDFTPAIKAEAQKIISEFDYGPIFTPPTVRGTINVPGWGGGANWSGAAYDPDTQMLYIPSNTGPMVVALQEGNPDSTEFRYRRGRGVNRLRGPQGLPITKPPYSRITAIDMSTGDHAWMVPHGDGIRSKVRQLGIADPGPLGGGRGTGPVLTKELLFIAQADNGKNLMRAYNKATGEVVAEIELPMRGAGTPMTYMADGKQYIAIASGQARDARLVALALPD